MVEWKEIVNAFEQLIAQDAKPTKLKIPQKYYETMIRKSINNPESLGRWILRGGRPPMTLGGAAIVYEGDINTGRFLLYGTKADGSEVEISGVL